MGKKLTPFEQRRRRVRTGLRLNAGDRPRLSVHRSSQHIYAQIIDDKAGTTLASASSLDKDAKDKAGATVAEVEEQIREAIAFHLDGLREDGVPAPLPSSQVEYVDIAA